MSFTGMQYNEVGVKVTKCQDHQVGEYIGKVLDVLTNVYELSSIWKSKEEGGINTWEDEGNLFL
jgi:hypothetical protein